jgi:hypothetical protein
VGPEADQPRRPTQTHVHVGQEQTGHLGCPQAAQDHGQRDGSVAVGVQVRHEGGYVVDIETLGQPTVLAHQPAVGPRSPAPEVAEHPPRSSAQAGRTATGRHGVVTAGTGDDGVLEQPPHRGHPAVHGRWRRAAPAVDAHDLPRRLPLRLGLPVKPVEQIGRHHVAQRDPVLAKEPAEVQHAKAMRIALDNHPRVHRQAPSESSVRLREQPLVDAQAAPRRPTAEGR